MITVLHNNKSSKQSKLDVNCIIVHVLSTSYPAEYNKADVKSISNLKTYQGNLMIGVKIDTFQK